MVFGYLVPLFFPFYQPHMQMTLLLVCRDLSIFVRIVSTFPVMVLFCFVSAQFFIFYHT